MQNLDIVPLHLILTFLPNEDRLRLLISSKFFEDDIQTTLKKYIDFNSLLDKAIQPVIFDESLAIICSKYMGIDQLKKLLNTAVIFDRPKLVEAVLNQPHKQLLIEDPNPLLKSVFNNSEKIVKILLKNGADPNCKDEFGDTPIIIASCRGYSRLVKLLLDSQANPDLVNKDLESPLICASQRGYKDIVWMLVRKGTDPRLCDKHDMTALMYAKICNHNYISTLLELNL